LKGLRGMKGKRIADCGLLSGGEGFRFTVYGLRLGG
jgi:hypothetical protein